MDVSEMAAELFSEEARRVAAGRVYGERHVEVGLFEDAVFYTCADGLCVAAVLLRAQLGDDDPGPVALPSAEHVLFRLGFTPYNRREFLEPLRRLMDANDAGALIDPAENRKLLGVADAPQ